MENLSTRSTVQTQEYFLQGSINDSSREILMHRLRGLCDNTEDGPEPFQDHEMIFAIKSATAQPAQPVMFRVRRSLIHGDVPWHMRYVGQAEQSRHTLMRHCIDVGCTDNAALFLKEMGFRLEYEFVAKGFMFRKGRMKVTVSKIFRMQQPGSVDPSKLEAVSLSFLVELSVIALAGQDHIQEDMKNFGEQLKPLVLLDKVDHRRVQMQ